MRRFTFASVLVLPLVAFAISVQAQDDELGEAQGLEPSPATQEVLTEGKSDLVPVRWRAYSLLDTMMRRSSLENQQTVHGPNIELGLALDSKISQKISLFFDGRTLYKDDTSKTEMRVDQGGVRMALGDEWMMAWGKERNRRAPGLIVSPSDFLHSFQSAPGLREERSGVWLGRLSWQTPRQSLDLVALPVNREQENGLPSSESQWSGAILRSFHRLPQGIDFGFDLATIEDETKVGAFLQTFVAKVWKLYGEMGYDDASESRGDLLGMSYEGLTDGAIRLEWYRQDANWKETQNTYFVEGSHVIASISMAELFDQFNLSETWLRSLDSNRFVNIARVEWVANDRNLAGLTWIHFEPQQPIRWQALIDWKLSL